MYLSVQDYFCVCFFYFILIRTFFLFYFNQNILGCFYCKYVLLSSLGTLLAYFETRTIVHPPASFKTGSNNTTLMQQQKKKCKFILIPDIHNLKTTGMVLGFFLLSFACVKLFFSFLLQEKKSYLSGFNIVYVVAGLKTPTCSSATPFTGIQTQPVTLGLLIMCTGVSRY